jgi:hypothetical protein
MLELRRHRTKYLQVDIASLEEECYNLRKMIGSYLKKIRLAELFEFVGFSGHTLMSWAGAVGNGRDPEGPRWAPPQACSAMCVRHRGDHGSAAGARR